MPNVAKSFTHRLYNQKLRKGESVMEHAFRILKQCFCKLGVKFDLHITFLLDVIVAYCLLHNILMEQSSKAMERLLNVLQNEGVVVDNHNEYE